MDPSSTQGWCANVEGTLSQHETQLRDVIISHSQVVHSLILELTQISLKKTYPNAVSLNYSLFPGLSKWEPWMIISYIESPSKPPLSIWLLITTMKKFHSTSSDPISYSNPWYHLVTQTQPSPWLAVGLSVRMVSYLFGFLLKSNGMNPQDQPETWRVPDLSALSLEQPLFLRTDPVTAQLIFSLVWPLLGEDKTLCLHLNVKQWMITSQNLSLQDS